MITLRDKRYPKLLKEIGNEAPKQLYYKGNWPARNALRSDAGRDTDIFGNCLAVVGSRRMTSYGKRVVEQIVTEIAGAGITIVSGFMYGVDATAHKAALRAGGRTIAVMPCGIDLIHPEYQQDLYAEILNSKGLVISEYEGALLPTNWTYPRRNRIVTGLSKAVLIIEAGEKSGSLITANWAKRFKRKLFAVPGPITSVTSKGALQLIKEGAELVTCAKDVLVYFKLLRKQNFEIEPPSRARTSRFQNLFSSHSLLEKKIIERLQGEPLGVDELSRSLGISVSELGVTLSMMQLRGLIHQEGSKYYPA